MSCVNIMKKTHTKSRDEKNKSRKEEKGRKWEFKDDSHFWTYTWPDEIGEIDGGKNLYKDLIRKPPGGLLTSKNDGGKDE